MKSITRLNYGNKRFFTQQFLKTHNKYAVTTYARPEFVLTEGKGSEVWDKEGKRYVDFCAGIAVTGLGHSEPGVSQILADQGQKLIHGSNLYYNEWGPRLSRTLVEKTLESGAMQNASRVFMCNSGTEANEAALKFARKYGRAQKEDKIELVSFKNGFHGRTMGALSMTPNPKYQEPFNPLIPGVKNGEINNIDSLKELVTDKTCGVIVEPIQGEGGVRACSEEFLTALRKRCDDVGALLIYDEIQCGLGRTGTLWAHGNLSNTTHPDIVTMAKALGNGFPIGATMVTEEVEKVLKVGDHGTTYGGNPLGCRIGDYVVNKITTPEVLQGVKDTSANFKSRFAQLKEKYPDVVQETRGTGLLLGLQLSRDPTPIVKSANENGLLVITCGTNTLRFVPALNIPKSLVDEGLDILDHAISKC